MISANDEASANKRPRVVVLTDCDIRSTQGRPQRIFDSSPLLLRLPSAKYAVWLTASDDVDLDQKLNRLGSQRFRRQIISLVSLLSIFRQLPALRAAPVIFCLTPHYFWWLALFWRLGLIPVEGKSIGGVFSRSHPFLKKIGWVKRLPVAFKAYFMVQRQLEDVCQAGCPKERLESFSWRIDTHWYRPAPRQDRRRDYLLCPGMAYRDEQLILRLIGQTSLRIIRAARTSALARAYSSIPSGNAGFEFRLVLNHAEYLDLLQHAALVLLPIATDDEPAGLTTALEAMACEVPLLANSSYGVNELLDRGYGRAPLPDNALETWLSAIDDVLHGKAISAEKCLNARKLVESEFSLGQPDQAFDWEEIAPIRPFFETIGKVSSPTKSAWQAPREK